MCNSICGENYFDIKKVNIEYLIKKLCKYITLVESSLQWEIDKKNNVDLQDIKKGDIIVLLSKPENSILFDKIYKVITIKAIDTSYLEIIYENKEELITSLSKGYLRTFHIYEYTKLISFIENLVSKNKADKEMKLSLVKTR